MEELAATVEELAATVEEVGRFYLLAAVSI